MRYTKVCLLLLGLAARAALAEITYTVTAIHKGKPVKPSDIVLERIEPGRHQLTTAARQPKPKSRGGNARRSNPTVYSTNWCGAVQHSPSTNPITSVHGFFQVPTLSQRAGVTSFPQYVAPWIGIDGATWSTALLQSGTTSSINSAGVQTNWAWLEWVPDAAYTIPNFPVATGDWIEVRVSASSSTSGQIYIYNTDQDYSYTVTLSNGSPLGRVDADWVIEDPATSSGLVPFAAFTETWFEEVSATRSTGTALGVDGATLYYLTDNRCVATEYDNDNFYAH
ncbi:concanavalin A-like lectin/glucanase [Phialemonium atrogriseum]|uniref:Concanavalin A-like lectin/glucanase n=1 Tax=Phialemonium atrogriseum TaxID=1093897 RepID=A0AAJ0C2J7_9PEZI|nr:concanavalin A-like lectin/glucanase [Phialemonium atrogriseum]KAK1767928.1 concanavalin A-like lectin/glucanase [Phialemonium atrogriseum]